MKITNKIKDKVYDAICEQFRYLVSEQYGLLRALYDGEVNLERTFPLVCPESGAFVAWKKCEELRPALLPGIFDSRQVIVKLLIPQNARRVSSVGRKCRADRAVVLEIQELDGNPLYGVEVRSFRDVNFKYRVGETVTPTEPFDDDRLKDCASGIHFFITRQEAVNY